MTMSVVTEADIQRAVRRSYRGLVRSLAWRAFPHTLFVWLVRKTFDPNAYVAVKCLEVRRRDQVQLLSGTIEEVRGEIRRGLEAEADRVRRELGLR